MIDWIIRALVAEFVGKYIRYYFFKLIGRERKLEYFSVDNDISQQFWNKLAGLIVILPLVIGIAYLIYKP